jgi:hypothetical protein
MLQYNLHGVVAFEKAHGLGQWPPLYMGGELAYHLPKWQSGRRNFICVCGVWVGPGSKAPGLTRLWGWVPGCNAPGLA